MKYRFAIALVFLAAMSRLLPHPPNFTSVGAMALFGAAYFNRQWLMLAIPFAALFVSDIALNNLIYKDLYGDHFVWVSSAWNYGSFAIVMLSGLLWFRKQSSVGRILGASLSASLLFFLVSNFGAWMSDSINLYPKTFSGLLTCYAAGLPFLGNTIAGDLFYSAVLFGLYHLVSQRFMRLQNV